MTAQNTPQTIATAPSSPAHHRAVTVHAGARDSYQLALGLAEHDLLETLVTDLFWASDTPHARLLARFAPTLARTLSQRGAPGLPPSRVHTLLFHGLRTLFAERIRRLPDSWRRRFHRASDRALGRAAGRFAARAGAGLVSYSYYGFHAMEAFRRPGMLFQVHPHPATMRRLLRQELADHPDCAESLQAEWELALPEPDFDHLVRETALFSRFLVASSFTKQSLVENGTDPDLIRVVPYGVDLQRFHPDPARATAPTGKLKLLFVGRINQRKGVKYLLQALQQLGTDHLHLTICGRVVDSLSLFRDSGLEIDLRPSVSQDELIAAYQAADLFVFPSVAEGFAQVLLESLACGLPILSTTHTAAPDLIIDGVEGFILPPRRPDLLAEQLAWCLDHRAELAAMRPAARRTAETFTWQRFRTGAANAVQAYLQEFSS